MDDTLLIRITPDDLTQSAKGVKSPLNTFTALRTSILRGLAAEPGKKTLPTTILYDEKGLELYDNITTLAGDHYYLFPAEESILKEHAKDVIQAMLGDDHSGGVLLELGSGSLRKTAHLISALSKSHKRDTPSGYIYYALDLTPMSLSRSLHSLNPIVQGNVELRGIVTDYETGLQWIRSGGLRQKQHSRVYDTSSRSATEDCVRPPKDVDEESRPLETITCTEIPVSTASTRAILPKQGWRIPNPQLPPTPPRSRSRDTSRNAEDEAETLGSANGKLEDRLHILFLGSSLGNFSKAESVKFLRSLPLSPGSGDTLLLGLDGRNEKERVERAYNDPEGHTKAFIMNGLHVAATALGIEDDLMNKFEYVGVFNEEIGRHEAYYQAKQSFTFHVSSEVPGQLESIHLQENELVNVEYSYKYSESEAYALFAQSHLRPITRWQDSQSLYSLWLLERPPSSFPLLQHPHVADVTLSGFAPTPSPSASYTSPATPSSEHSSISDGPDDSIALSLAKAFAKISHAYPETASESNVRNIHTEPFGSPSRSEFHELWNLWDEITTHMIPDTMLWEKPIDLRHICLFYLGHIPVFLDIQLSKLLDEPHTDPEYFKDIFERGVDPCVDDPTQIHPHSGVPTATEDWPPLPLILQFRDHVRSRIDRLYDSIEGGEAVDGYHDKITRLGRRLHRVLWMCLEHEGWHAETLLYMLIRRAGTPGGTIPPSRFPQPMWLSMNHSASSPSPQPSSDRLITLPAQSLTIGHDDVEAEDFDFMPNLPFALHEFGWDNEHPTRSVDITRPIKVEKRCVSNEEYAAFLRDPMAGKGRKQPESWVRDENGLFKVRTLYGPVDFSIAAEWPFVSSYDDLEAYAMWKGGRIPNEVELRAFMDQYLGAENSNIGFKNWSFIPPEEPDPVLDKRGHNGGSWEWTSTTFDTYDGFTISTLYPGYSGDFFDGRHNVCLGGSFATIPRIAHRRSVRNFYQHNYPYAWVGGRVVYDL